jgi:hypothetical protein
MSQFKLLVIIGIVNRPKSLLQWLLSFGREKATFNALFVLFFSYFHVSVKLKETNKNNIGANFLMFILMCLCIGFKKAE